MCVAHGVVVIVCPHGRTVGLRGADLRRATWAFVSTGQPEILHEEHWSPRYDIACLPCARDRTGAGTTAASRGTHGQPCCVAIPTALMQYLNAGSFRTWSCEAIDSGDEGSAAAEIGSSAGRQFRVTIHVHRPHTEPSLHRCAPVIHGGPPVRAGPR